MLSKTLLNELDNLTGSTESEAAKPHFRGGSAHDIATDADRLSLSETFSSVDSA